MADITVEAIVFENPRWSSNTANPGDTITLAVDASDLTAEQEIVFTIRQGPRIVDVLQAASEARTVEWEVPNFSDSTQLQFDAILRERPGTANGHQAVLAQTRLLTILTVAGFRVEMTSIDEAFVPGLPPGPDQEKLEAAYRLHGNAPASGRYEIWGERYPTDQPIYTENFVPAAGNTTWNSWNGGGITTAPLNGLFLTPEFTPYRLKIIVGPDAVSVQDPYGAGKGKVSIAERQFQVVFQSVHIRLQDLRTPAPAIEAAADDSNYVLSKVLAIEPRIVADGSYANTGRLPNPARGATAAERCRIRIPMACHFRPTDSLDQGGLLVGDNYMEGAGAGLPTKWTIDSGFYTRPEIPIEFELRLKSKHAAINTDPNRLGLFVPAAIGPAKIEPIAEDYYDSDLYTGAPAGSNLELRHQPYWQNAAFKIKCGEHDDPHHSPAPAAPGDPGNAPVFDHWQVRFEVAGDGEQHFDVGTVDPTINFTFGSNELSVYLNRTKLTLAGRDLSGANANRPDGTPYPNDYAEADPGGGVGSAATVIDLVDPNLTKTGDILWIVRTPSAPATVAIGNWNKYPPGTNCHEHYGGIRGDTTTDPNNLFRKDYSTVPAAPLEPIIGRATADFPYKDGNYVNLKPDSSARQADQERVEIQALTAAPPAAPPPKLGLAGVIFSPSYIAGDSYVLKTRVERTPYERNLGYEADSPQFPTRPPDPNTWMGTTGILTVWRLLHIGRSLRLPEAGTIGLAAATALVPAVAATVAVPGLPAIPPAPAVGSISDNVTPRPYHGDGRNMSITRMNEYYAHAFNEWAISEPKQITVSSGGTPIQITSAAHDLQTGDVVTIDRVAGNAAANGTFVIDSVNADNFTLHQNHNFVGAAVVGPPVAGPGVGIVGAGGEIDVHIGANLRLYANIYNAVAGLNNGRLPMASPADIKNVLAPFDHYREQLPPGLGGVNRENAAAAAIHRLPAGTASEIAADAVSMAIAHRDAAVGAAGADLGVPPGGAIPSHPGPDDVYNAWVNNLEDTVTYDFMDALIPQVAQPRFMNVLRWPIYADRDLWIGFDPGTGTFSWDQMMTFGECIGNGQSYFMAAINPADLDDTLFPHEEGHSINLAHFVTENFAWKHHDLNHIQCMMSYDYTCGFIPQPAAPPHVIAGPNAPVTPTDQGWPHRYPPLPLHNNIDHWEVAPGAVAGADAIRCGPMGDPANPPIDANPPGPPMLLPRMGEPAELCAKCILKARGWKEDVLPCAWRHPDLF